MILSCFQEFCKLDNAHLVYVNNKEEQDYLKSKARHQGTIEIR